VENKEISIDISRLWRMLGQRDVTIDILSDEVNDLKAKLDALEIEKEEP